jgi:hypothetical protein
LHRTRLEHAITELRQLLRAGVSPEKRFQRFFEANPVIFQVLGYAEAYPKPHLPLSDGGYLEPDFVLKRPDGLFEIFELKTPQEKLVVVKRHRDKFREPISEYVSQAHTYSDYFDDSANRERVKDELGFDIQKSPDMTIVAGRDAHVDKKLLYLLVRRQSGALRLLTYDDLLSWLIFHHTALYGDTESLNGASWHAILTLYAVKVPRRQYIFDAGDSLSRNRWSVYVDENGRLTFGILDRNGHGRTASIASDTRDFTLGFRHYICCEFGSSDSYAIMQILVDNRIAETQESASPLLVSSGLDFSRRVIGADLEGKNHGTFDMAGLAIYKSTLTFDERQGLAKAIFDEFFSPPDLAQLASSSERRRPVLPNTGAFLILGELGELE